jgi:exodeoxyribonuclease VIII
MHVMIDLETMGTRPNSPVVSIGAVAFQPWRQHKDGEVQLGGIVSKFYEVIDLAWSVRDGAVIEPETVIWWLGQGDKAREAITRRGIEPKVALQRFSDWLGPWEPMGVWGNGASFDNVMLTEAYRRAGIKAPWPFWQDRCYRTIKSLYPQVELVRMGEHHNALDDAISQAMHLIEIDKVMGGVL